MVIMLVSITENQAKSNEKRDQSIKQLLDYCTTHPGVTIIYKHRDVVLRVHSDEPYLSESQFCSKSGGIYI